MKLYAFVLASCAFFSTSVSAMIDDESLNARSEYYYQQSQKRAEAARAKREEELKHIHVLDMNSLLKTLADDDEEIAEVVVIYKKGNKERYLSPIKEEAAATTPSSPAPATAPAVASPSKTTVDNPSWIEGRRFAGQRVW